MSDIEWPKELRPALMWLKENIGAERLKKASAFIRNADGIDREEVTRYRPIVDANGDAGMVPCATGFWVTIDDYRDITERKDQAEAENKALVGALEDIAEGEPDPDNLAEMIWCKDRAAECLTTIRARSNKDQTND